MGHVTAPSGQWRGTTANGVTVHHGIRYARAARFEQPRREPAHREVIDVTIPGPVAPQLPSRLEAVMGVPAPLAQSEDCLTVTVTAPAGADPGSCPVLVWLHGGAYLSGSGQWNLYAADRLVRETGIVVVAVGYRLGVLGYLKAPGISAGNLGLLDQITALEWVRDNITAFGGDPARVTVSGQSAGAQSVVAMLGIERARATFSQAIVQSAPLGLHFHGPEEAQRVADVFLDELQGDPHRADIADLLAAQARTACRLAGPAALNSAPPLLPVYDTDPLPARRQWQDAVVRGADGLRVLIGTTADEMGAFYGHHPVFSAVRRVPVLGPRLVAGVQQLVQRKVFDAPTDRFADLLTDAGADVRCFRFHRLHPSNPFGACHCIELPLLFGSDEAWRDAPMLHPLVPDDAASIGARTRRYWGEFVRSGDISDTTWPRHRTGSGSRHALP
ncbi:carboxylesterase family protein [Rhodococcus sp. NPDC003382]